MDRRQFLQRALRKTGESVVNQVEEQVNRRAAHWIRPPYALDELEFLLACTRCNACVEACTYQIIFPLPSRLGAQVVGTPALDLANQGCHLCAAWPCVTACEPGALNIPAAQDNEASPLPRMATAEIDTSACLPYLGPECGACAAYCPVPGAMIWELARPRIDPVHCTGCALCREACIVEPKAIKVASLYHSEAGQEIRCDHVR